MYGDDRSGKIIARRREILLVAAFARGIIIKIVK